MENQNTRAKREREIERDRLFSLSSHEVSLLSHADQYQRMRYEREIQGNEYVFLLSKGYSREEALIQATKNADRIVSNWKTAHGHG